MSAEFLLALKRSVPLRGPVLTLTVGQPLIVQLRPVGTATGAIRDADIEALTSWRNRFVNAFLTEFPATAERTRTWLTTHVGPSPKKMLFMVDLPDGETIGYMGLDYIDWAAGYGEADSIVRGGDAPPRTMARALTTLLEWGRSQLGLREIGVRVRSDNPALEFYRKMGFVDRASVPLLARETPDGRSWSEAPGATSPVALVHMRWSGAVAG